MATKANKKKTPVKQYPQEQYGAWEEAGQDGSFLMTRDTAEEMASELRTEETREVVIYKLDRIVRMTKTSTFKIE